MNRDVSGHMNGSSKGLGVELDVFKNGVPLRQGSPNFFASTDRFSMGGSVHVG